MADRNDTSVPPNLYPAAKLTDEHQLAMLNTDEVRLRNREQLIENLERVIQEKNASINKLEERDQVLNETLHQRNVEFHLLEERLKQYEEKTCTFEQLHRLQVQTFEKTIRDCQHENERLYEHVSDLTNELREKTSHDFINKEKILTFDRIVADIRLWREKLDSYKATIEQHEETISSLRKEISDLQRQKQTNIGLDDTSLRLQITKLQATVEDRDSEIDHLKVTLRRVRDTLQTDHPTHQSRWQSCNENIGRNPLRSPPTRKRSLSPPIGEAAMFTDVEALKKKCCALAERLTDVQQLLVTRDDQVVTLKKVHDKRWLRLKHLQKQYRSMKDELQLYTDDQVTQKTIPMDFSYRKAIRKSKIGCSVCNDHRWRKATGTNEKVLKQEDDDQIWNEITKLRRDNNRLTDENLSLHEKLDLQEVEINEQAVVIGELHHEIRTLHATSKFVPIRPATPPAPPKFTPEQTHVIKELDGKLYQLETERTSLVFEQERLKTNLELALAEKQQFAQQRTQAKSELKKAKLQVLSLQDQVQKLKRKQTKETKKDLNPPPLFIIQRRMMRKKAKKPFSSTKSCLEILLDQNTSFMDDLHNQSVMSSRREHSNDNSLIRRTRKASISSILSKKRGALLKRNAPHPLRLSTPLTYSKPVRKLSASSSTPRMLPTRIASLRERIEKLETNLASSQVDNDHLHQRLSTTLARINILKTTNQKLTSECDQYKTSQLSSPIASGPSSNTIDQQGQEIEHLYDRLKNASLDAAQQRKLNKTLQTDNENFTKHIQLLTEKLTHAERDITSKRSLLETYKSRLNELEIHSARTHEKNNSEVKGADGQLKLLTETAEKLRISIESYRNRLQAVTREKHELELRLTQLAEEHEKLKTRFDDQQSKLRFNDQQLRQVKLENEHLNQELFTSRHVSEQQLHTINTKTQDSLGQLTFELDRTRGRLNECEKFTREFLHEMIRRSTDMHESLKRAHGSQKHRESLSMSLPGYDTAMNTASKILNLTQDDLDEIMSMTDESFHVKAKLQTGNNDERLREKVSKLFASYEQFSGKLLKIFTKKLDEIQAADRELAVLRNT